MTPVSEWLALRRVHEGSVTLMCGIILKHGRPVADHLAGAVTELIRTGHLALGRPALDGQQRVCTTHTGQRRYDELNRRQAPG